MQGDTVLVTSSPEEHGPLIQRLGAQGYCVLPIRTVREAFKVLQDSSCIACLAIFDVTLRRQQDFETLASITTNSPLLHIILPSEYVHELHHQLRVANGRVHFLGTTLSNPRSMPAIENILVKASKAVETSTADQDNVKEVAADELLLYSEAFLSRVGQANVPVLLHGETGVGKEVMARRLWSCSPRANKPFLKLNCAAFPSELIESELFGYEKGAFTGATTDKPGRFEVANEGTILLDEIGDMDIRLQAKLLHVLQDGEIQPLGGNRTVKVNVRIMASTHRDLRRSIEEGTFREDLFYRLSVVDIYIAPLRDRRDEIVPLAEILLRRHMPHNAKPPDLSPQLKQAMLDYDWPGNVRELENVMRRFLVYQDAGLIIRELMPKTYGSRTKPPISKTVVTASQPELSEASTMHRLAEASREAESRLLLDALESTRWNRRQAAARLNIEYKAFLYKLQKHGIVEARAKRGDVSA